MKIFITKWYRFLKNILLKQLTVVEVESHFNACCSGIWFHVFGRISTVSGIHACFIWCSDSPGTKGFEEQELCVQARVPC